jgi:hypothetical protein
MSNSDQALLTSSQIGYASANLVSAVYASEGASRKVSRVVLASGGAPGSVSGVSDTNLVMSEDDTHLPLLDDKEQMCIANCRVKLDINTFSISVQYGDFCPFTNSKIVITQSQGRKQVLGK